jgi:hypothetical protein
MPFKNPHYLYQTWISMKSRCNNKNAPNYAHYGGRGIKVCEKWVSNFHAFVSDMGERPYKHEIDRINNDGDYTPDNCRWVTRKENMRNRRITVRVIIDGVEYLACDLAERYGLKQDTIVDRAGKGLCFADVVTKEKHRDLSGLTLGGQASGAKKRKLTHCKHGHEFTPENTIITKQGWRRCKTCKNLGQQAYMARNK